MEQDNSVSCSSESSVSENRDFITYYHQIQPSTSNYHPVQPSASNYHPVQPSASNYYLIQPSTSNYHLIQPSTSNYHPIQPSTSNYHPIQPSTSNYHPIKPSTSNYHPIQPSTSNYHPIQPSSSSSHPIQPSSNSSHPIQPSSSNSHPIQPSVSSSTNYYPDPYDITEDDLPSIPLYQHSASNTQQPECNSESNHSEPSQASAHSHESSSDEEKCTCNNDDSPYDSEAERRSILGEIIDDIFEEIVIEHCFRMHQAAKLGVLTFDDATEETNEEQEEPPLSTTVTCPNCNNKHDLKDYKVELGKCMRLTTRKSKRNTTRAQPNFAETSVDSFPDQSKSKKRRQQSKKGASKNAKVRLLQDDSDLYSKELDGHATKSGNKRTKKGSSASKPQTKTTMPQLDSSYKPSPSFQDEYETIDVDTVEETSPFPAVSNYDLTDHSSPEFSNSLVTRKEENGKIKMIIKSDPQKKKKKKKSKHEPYPGNS